MVCKWLKGSEFNTGLSRKPPYLSTQDLLPHVSLSELVRKYLREKPNQPMCAQCGTKYLWRSGPKVWELASWQIARPEDATHELPVVALRPGSKTFGRSWHFLNGKPLTCSLCTVVTCGSCSRVFNWGDQLRRARCPCGGEVLLSNRIGPQPRIVECLEHEKCLQSRQPCQGTVFVRHFERRCVCCRDMERYLGLEYLSYHDPGEDLKLDGRIPRQEIQVWAGYLCSMGGKFERALYD